MWSPETIKLFISLYQAEPVLWKKIPGTYNNRYHNEAWVRISKKMGLSVRDLKRLKKVLYCRFLFKLRKYQHNSQSGEKFEIYNPDWFVDDPNDAFFGTIYQLRLGCKKASIKYPVKKVLTGETSLPNHGGSTDALCEVNAECQYPVSAKLNGPFEKHCQNNPPNHIMLSAKEVAVFPTLTDEVRKENDRIVNKDPSSGLLNPTSSNPSRSTQIWARQNTPPVSENPAKANETSVLNEPFREEKDDCELYTTLLASKLRRLPEKDRLQLMYKIDGLLIGGLVPQNNYPFKPIASPFVQNFYPFSYPASPQFTSYFQQNVIGTKIPPYSSFPVLPPK